MKKRKLKEEEEEVIMNDCEVMPRRPKIAWS